MTAFQGESGVEALQKQLSERLWAMFQKKARPDWPWCEERVTYDNARLPQALIVSGNRLGNPEMTQTGLRTLSWLAEIQRSKEGYFAPIGSNGFYQRSGEKARFDQQPLEASAMVSACLEAWRVTGDERWTREARRAFRWLIGENQLQLSLYDSATGGCRDGLHPDRANENQGAESTLAFLQSLLEMRLTENIDQPKEPAYNEQSALGPLSTLQTQRDPDTRQLAVSNQ